MAPATTKRNQSIAKALQIVEVMADADGPMRLQDIGKNVKLPASTVLRFLKTLMDHGYVEQNPRTLQYYLTLKFCQISERIKRQIKVRDIAHPVLVELSRELREATSLAVARDGQVVYVDVVEGPDHMLQTLQRIGKIAPMNSTGVGKALIQDYTGDEITSLVTTHGLPKPTPNTIGSKRALVKELSVVRDQGYATDDEECEVGVRCIAAPVRDYSGAVIAAISTSGPVGRMTPDRMKKIAPRMTRAAAEISRQLGYEE
ncbi:MAG: IclR family transcriptional regulator [Spirochaetota bacterium]